MPSKRATLVGVAIIAATVTQMPATVVAASPARPIANVRIADHFDISAGQQPENIALEPGGAIDVNLAVAHQVVRIYPSGRRQVLATLPAPVDGGVHTPILGFALLTGLVRDDSGNLYFLYVTGTSELTGLWRLTPGGVPERISPLPADSLPNGLGLDPASGELYSADSALGIVWRMSVSGGHAIRWATAAGLAPSGSLGANGLKIHEGAVWVTNTSLGTVVRIPVLPDGCAGPIEVKASGLVGIDDFAFVDGSDQMIAAIDGQNEVAIIEPDGTHSVVLTGSDGLENPTSIALRGHTAFIASAAWATRADPNLIVAHLR